MIKKLCVITGFSFCVVLTACGGGGGGEENPQQDDNSQSNVIADPTPATEPTTTEPTTTDSQPQEPADETQTFSATIQWDIPTTRQDGNDLLLSEIGGYEVFYKRSNDSDYQKQVVDLGTSSQLTLENLIAGEYEVFIKTYDTEGLYSQNSTTLLASIGI